MNIRGWDFFLASLCGKEKDTSGFNEVTEVTCICILLKLKSEGTALSFSTRLLHSRLKQSLVKC